MKVADILRIKGSVVKTVAPRKRRFSSQGICVPRKLVPWS